MINIKTKIHIIDSLQSGPWGGGNQFLKALKVELIRRRSYADDWNEADVILINSYQHILQALKIKTRHPDMPLIYRLGPVFFHHRNGWKAVDRIEVDVANSIADAIVCQSAWTLRELLKLGLNGQKRCNVISNAVNPTIFNTENKSEFHKEGKCKLVCTSWSTNRNKGFAYYHYLDEHLDYNQYEMVFVGNTPIQFKHIKMIEPAPSVELASILKQSDIFVSGVKDDACSNSIIEALSCGLPVVALNSGGNAEIIKDGGALFDGPDDMISNIATVRDNYSLYQAAVRVQIISDIADQYLTVAAQAMRQKRLIRRICAILLYFRTYLRLELFRLRSKLN